MNPFKLASCRRTALLLATILVSLNFRAVAALANAWHIPDDASDLGFNMRNPEFAIGTTTAITFYTGVWKYNNGVQLCNQTGGTLYYKTAAQTAWSSTNLSFYSNTSANQYWQAPLNGSLFNANDTVQYFFLLTFDGYGGVTNTWLYGNNAASSTTDSSNTASASPFTFAVTNNVIGTPVLTVNGVNADYTTTHVFVNELNNDAIPFTLLFSPNAGTVTNVEIFSNLNRRNRAALDANGDGIEDGIVPPDGNLIPAGDDNNYYKAYPMTNLGGGQYSLTLNATNCGAYRLTARFKVVGNPAWFWYSGGSTSRRDHAIVVTPTKARNIVMYELNAMNIDADGSGQNDRSTFTDLYNGPGSKPYDAATNRFNLQYVQNLGVNWLWFQPIHPIGIDGRQTDPDTGQPYSVGSPYAVKNFFQVNPLLSKANTRDAAMAEFTNFVAAADAANINVMLDEPFNHTAFDAELDASGVYYFATNAATTDEIRNREARFYSLSNDYCERASSAANVAIAPDRGDFGKFTDTHDVYFGRYSALVCQNPADNGNYLNEGDTFDYSTSTGNFDGITQNVWRYFADSLLYWLDKTGCPVGTPANQTFKGIDGVRADFGQGLPPQCWEYIINKVRSRKWDFVFMTESLDGGAVTYRSNRHFDILNESLLFDLQNAASASDYRNAFDARRSSYGQSLVLLNNTSHDEETYSDPYLALIRYAACGTIDGAPMTFYGEELGISTTFGFDQYELNFGKNIPNFKKYNSLQPVLKPANRTYALDQLWPVYAGINQARNFSPALRSSSRYYLNQTGSETPQANIFSVAKYVTANGAPNFNDVVFAFTPLDRNNTQAGNFDVNITQNGTNLFGIKPARIYNVKNISAYTAIDGNRRNVWLWGGGIAGSNVLANGVYVSLNPVPASNGAWTTSPFEAQYLKLYDVTPPPAPVAPATGSTNNYVFANNVTFSWPTVTDTEGGVSGYHVWVGTTPGGSNVFSGIVNGTTLSVTNTFGVRLYATFTAVNNAGIESPASNTSTGILLLNPAWVPVASMTTPNLLNWSSISGLTYRVWSTTNLALPFTAYSGMVTATIPTLTFTNNPTNSAQYFKVQLIP
ncbi:MAG TPA: alpha-amylase family glycosyl hydrolase [Verrucomicrobiae bacterium]|nr:alpha-amylase family glycosyl hydrolase [Verrucomicrobiae bacterium]